MSILEGDLSRRLMTKCTYIFRKKEPYAQILKIMAMKNFQKQRKSSYITRYFFGGEIKSALEAIQILFKNIH